MIVANAHRLPNGLETDQPYHNSIHVCPFYALFSESIADTLYELKYAATFDTLSCCLYICPAKLA